MDLNTVLEMRMIKLYNTYREVKDVFVKPKLKVYFGLWKNDPNLPVWRDESFHIFNFDVMYKPKWEEWRYEFPPQFTIVAFGLSLTFTLHCPINDKYSSDDHYWECILEYLYGRSNKSIINTLLNSGIWTGSGQKYHQLRREYLKKEYQEQYDTALVIFKHRYHNLNVI